MGDPKRKKHENPIRTLVAASTHLGLELLEDHLEYNRVARVLGAVRDLELLRTGVQLHRPDAVIVVLPLPGAVNWLDFLQLRTIQPELAFVFFLDRDEEVHAWVETIRFGSVALLSRESHAAEMGSALSAIASGSAVIGKVLLKRLSERWTYSYGLSVAQGPQLTSRQKTIFEQLANGLTEDSISHALSISIRTVQGDIAEAREKLKATDRTHAIVLALQLGLIRGPLHPNEGSFLSPPEASKGSMRSPSE